MFLQPSSKFVVSVSIFYQNGYKYPGRFPELLQQFYRSAPNFHFSGKFCKLFQQRRNISPCIDEFLFCVVIYYMVIIMSVAEGPADPCVFQSHTPCYYRSDNHVRFN